jgi:uncharacterized repeat protein (TIGR01451 family)
MTTSALRAPWWVGGVLLSIVLASGVCDVTAGTTFTYVKIADTDTPIPGGTGNFTFVGQPGVVDGVVAFRGEGVGNHGIFTRAVNDPTSLVARYDKNTVVPGTTNSRFSDFGTPSFSAEGMAFSANGNNLFSDFGGVLHRVAGSLVTPIPGGVETFFKFSRPWLGGGVVVFRGMRPATPSTGTPAQDGIYAFAGGTLRRVADTSTPVPGGTGTFVSFGTINAFSLTLTDAIPATDGEIIVFRGTGSAGEHGVYKEVGGVLHVVADRNTPIPGGTGTFTDFNFSVLAGNIQDGAIVFVGDGPNGQRGLYHHDGATLSVVVDQNTPVPGAAGNFSSFATQGMGFDNGYVSFLGDGAGAPQGVYTSLGGVIRVVARNGQVVDGKTLGAMGTYGRGLSGNMIAFNVGNFGGGIANYVAIASNDPPTANPDSFTVTEDVPRTLNVLANDTDPDGDALFITGFTQGTRGTVSCGPTSCAYAPAPNVSGPDQFTYTVSDGRGGSAVGTVTLAIAAVNDADLGVILVPSETTVGRGRTLTYTIVVSNAGPDTANGVVLKSALPSGTTFAAAKTSQGILSTPAVGAGGALIGTLGSIAPRTTATVTLTVNVLVAAPSVLVNTAQASSNAQDATPANNTAQAAVKVVSVGTFVLTPGHTNVVAGDHARLALEWMIPGPSWRDLKTLDLRVRDHKGTVLLVRLTEGTSIRLALADAHGRFGPGKEPGSHAVLSNTTATVYLKNTSVTADGTNDSSVTLTLDVSFERRTAGRSYVVEVRASDDLGNVQDWMKAGTLTVHAPHHGHGHGHD